MIIRQKIDLTRLSKLGKNHRYQRPKQCFRCSSIRIWGHGYVARYFDGYNNRLYLKRWICADCGCVFSIRPCNYYPRHHSSIKRIADCIKYRLKNGVWIRGPDLSRQKQGHWLRSLKNNILLFHGFNRFENILDGFKQLIFAGQCPILRTT